MKNLPCVLFFGSDAICLPFLDFLVGEGARFCRLGAVISQPDRPQGRGRKLRPNPVAEWAARNEIRLLQPEKPDSTLVEELAALEPAVGFVMAYGHFLSKALRELPRYGLVNFHGSILPAYRGASPVETALAEGESKTGISLMEVVREMDGGGVADVERVQIDKTDTGLSLRAKMGEAVVPLMRRNLSASLNGGLHFQPQNGSEASYCRKITKEDAAFDFALPAEQICARLRAFTPWPGGYFESSGERIKAGLCHSLEEDTDQLPGTVLPFAEDGCLRIACGKGVLVVGELQRAGGRMLSAADFLRGYPLEVGLVLESVPARSLVD
ncbi:MAG: methionyl-tRNA formyltransferase [Coraliomargaritaceae bacterium]